MIYNYNNFDEDFFNAKGKAKQSLVLSQLSNLIVNERVAVINAFNQAGIPMDKDAKPNKIKRVVFRRSTGLNNPKNRKLIRNLSILIFADTRKPEDEFATFFKKKDGGGGNTAQKSGWLKNLFKKKDGGGIGAGAGAGAGAGGTKPKGQFFTKAKDFFGRNKEAIGGIGKSLLDGLFNKGGRGQVNEQVSGYQQQQGGGLGSQGGYQPPSAKKGMGMGTKILIGSLSLVALIGIIWAVRRKK